MAKVFLSYRRSDTTGEVGRLADSVRQAVGSGLTFRDATNIAAGAEFDSVLRRELSAAKIVLVLIGPTWLDELKRRLARPEPDYVRLEVAGALEQRKRVVPVLLRDAALPHADALPPDLVALVKRQTVTLRDQSWDSDVERLLDEIGRPYRLKPVITRAIIAMVAIVVGVKLSLPLLPADRANDIDFLRMLIALLAGCYALVEAAVALRYHRQLQRKYQTQAS